MKLFFFLVISACYISTNCWAQNKFVTLDYYFNNEFRKSSGGVPERFHFTWEDRTNSGFSLWGNIFRKNGLGTNSLETAPTANNLKETAIYIIVDPDTKKETANPHYMVPQYVKVIADWVKSGGVLVLMANDSANAELEHFNKLSETFGISFTNELRNQVSDEDFELGAIPISEKHQFFKTAKKIFLRDISTIKISKSAKSILSNKGEIVMAVAKYGKGTVFAVGDPWLYNEYMNGKLPLGFDNDKAADDLTKWLIEQIPDSN